MSKSLDALNNLYEYLKDEYEFRGMKEIDENKAIVEKELKALEIFKKLFEANVLGVLKTNDSKCFLRVFDKAYEINKEEYESLKESFV